MFSSARIRRLQDDKAYDASIIEVVKMKYREYIINGSKSSPIGVRFHVPLKVNPDENAAPVIPRRMRMKPEDFETYGFTVGCPGCEQIQLDSSVRKNHSEQCRIRMETEIGKSSAGQDRLSKAKDRIDTKTAEMGEAYRP